MNVNHGHPDRESLAQPGSPLWWSGRPAAVTPRRRGRPPRSVERIVSAAVELLDDVGTDAFTMRLLSERIGSGTATLYRHFAGKDELMVHIVDLVLGMVDVGGDEDVPGAADWRDTIVRAADALHEVLQRHPNVLPLLTAQVPVGPNALAQRERTLALLIDCGVPLELAARAYTAVAHYVLGFAVQQCAPTSRPATDPTALRDFYAALDSTRYPATAAAANELTSVPVLEEFQFGLRLILDGIEHACTLSAGGESGT